MSARAVISTQKLAATHVTPSNSGFLQRQCACGNHTVAGGTCEGCKDKNGMLQRASIASSGRGIEGEVPPIVHDVLRSPGQPLDSATRAFMEPRFGHDFSQVRVHTDANAAESSRAVNALAYMVGQDVMFGAGQYAPGTPAGNKILAHELTHVVQQAAAGNPVSQPVRAISNTSDAAEVEADFVANQIMNGGPVEVIQPPSAAVHTLSLGAGLGILGAVGLGFGVAALAGAFDKTTFTSDELKAYLDGLKSGHIEGKTDSDNKARAIVQRWQAGQSEFSILTVPIRVLLIQEMASGYLSGDDQAGILALLRESIPSELNY
jgi:hypothetical protein